MQRTEIAVFILIICVLFTITGQFTICHMIQNINHELNRIYDSVLCGTQVQTGFRITKLIQYYSRIQPILNIFIRRDITANLKSDLQLLYVLSDSGNQTELIAETARVRGQFNTAEYLFSDII